jgi:hypothetical protein
MKRKFRSVYSRFPEPSYDSGEGSSIFRGSGCGQASGAGFENKTGNGSGVVYETLEEGSGSAHWNNIRSYGYGYGTSKMSGSGFISNIGFGNGNGSDNCDVRQRFWQL